ncbi:pyruvate dehydrogenase (acetyl-transferring) E1 component subunit alpha [Prosthecobacter sp.]|uniref:pyruvate dehydrogenase (acetyl-transferring) E1 component subunit alpha n=1 Tax=Prosthecobacter sp. TaxID=1965333 RepID=UPI00248A2B19|nr:pyruvate dehydrogenase (acetyl-transferring) E1 component subunit alpha [Prosthecobacter sp.]MDI1314400.1 pyruvate dehydrogenase (acetyl-transferring) E1 component subunit alpha [Prosthecobacter sp.]
MATAKAPSNALAKHAADPINQKLTAADKVGLYRQMVRIRRFEQVSLQHYQAGKMGGFLHLYIGQESVAVGTVSVMGENDHVITAYRDHAHALAVGMGMNECMAELYGKATGCSRGKGGSMHYFAPDKNYWGGHGIVAGQTPLGLGLAYGLKYRGLKGAALCFLGDGAVNQGAFHESLNLAELWDLPVIYVIENNGYSMGTSQQRSSAYVDYLAKRAEGYGMAWEQFNGADIYEVRAGVSKAIERAHSQSKPSIIEIATYRWEGHSVADANKFKYRTKEEVEQFQNEHDPIQVWKRNLLTEGVATEEELKKIDKEAQKEAEDSAEFAKASPYPEPESIFEDVYWEVDNKTEAGQTGRHFFND